MNRDWQNFKALHHNIEGAREGFEIACETLFRKVYPSQAVSQMAVNQGDGGIDIFVGKFSIEPIIVIQCKFFLDSFGDTQKAQIRDSFNRARHSQQYELKEWILVLPRVIDIEANSWWFNWIEKQDIVIRLINGNELIDLMKEHNVYNQIFQMEDSLRLKEIHEVLVLKPKKIKSLSHESLFLENIFKYLRRKKPMMLLSITSSSLHYRIENYYKDKIIVQAKKSFKSAIFMTIELPDSKVISEKKYFQSLGKQCNFEEKIDDSYDFKILIEERLKEEDVFLIVSEFENGLNEHREIFASQLRALHQKFAGKLYTVLFGREKLASLKHKMGVLSPLNIFDEYLLPTPTSSDYRNIIEEITDIDEIYNLTGGHPKLMEYCFENIGTDYESLLLEYNEIFDKYYDFKNELLMLLEQETFGYFMIWSNRNSLHRALFWDNLIVQEGSKFRWISPLVRKIGKRYLK